jgi:hypothetical protein
MTEQTDIQTPIRVQREVVEFRVRQYGARDWKAPVETARHTIEYRTMSQSKTHHARNEKLIADEVQVFVDGQYAGDIHQDECRSERYSTSPIADVLGYPVKWLTGYRQQWVREAMLARIVAKLGPTDYRGREHKVSSSPGYLEHNSRREAVASLLGYDHGAKAITKKQLAEEAAAKVADAA